MLLIIVEHVKGMEIKGKLNTKSTNEEFYDEIKIFVRFCYYFNIITYTRNMYFCYYYDVLDTTRACYVCYEDLSFMDLAI